MSHHVYVALPDGRQAVADYRLPVVRVMRRIHRKVSENKPGNRADYELLAEWMDLCPEQQCPEDCNDGPEASHPPALQEPYTPPGYRRPVSRNAPTASQS